ncbi:MAG: hypothetical protein R2713_06605 [Ilumatobacteraceae bacterium]
MQVAGADSALQVDGERSSVLTEVPPTLGDDFELAVQFVEVQPSELSGTDADEADPVTVELPPAITDLATLITAGATSDVDWAASIARYLATEYVLDPETPPGHSLAELELFLTRPGQRRAVRRRVRPARRCGRAAGAGGRRVRGRRRSGRRQRRHVEWGHRVAGGRVRRLRVGGVRPVADLGRRRGHEHG